MRRQTFATLAILLLALLFGWETRQALRSTPGGPDNAATAPAGVWRPGTSAPDPPSPPDPTPAASAVAARPLFRPDRQPFREAAAGVSVRNYEAELSRYTLLGVLGLGDAPYGVVVGKGGNKGERWEVRRGDSLQGFTVKEVGVEGLQLTADGREFLLPLYAGAPTAAGGAVRTETTRRDAAQATPPPRAGTPASSIGRRPRVKCCRPAGAAVSVRLSACVPAETEPHRTHGAGSLARFLCRPIRRRSLRRATSRADDERRPRRNGEKTNETDGLAVRRCDPRGGSAHGVPPGGCGNRAAAAPRDRPDRGGCPRGTAGYGDAPRSPVVGQRRNRARLPRGPTLPGRISSDRLHTPPPSPTRGRCRGNRRTVSSRAAVDGHAASRAVGDHPSAPAFRVPGRYSALSGVPDPQATRRRRSPGTRLVSCQWEAAPGSSSSSTTRTSTR